MTQLDGSNALVVGGSGGIGAATVRMLAGAGARVAIGYHHGVERAAALLSSLPGAGHTTVLIDLGKPESMAATAAVLGKQFGSVHILVNAAGATRQVPHADLDALDDDLLDGIMAANVQDPFAVIRALVPLMRLTGLQAIPNSSERPLCAAVGQRVAATTQIT